MKKNSLEAPIWWRKKLIGGLWRTLEDLGGPKPPPIPYLTEKRLLINYQISSKSFSIGKMMLKQLALLGLVDAHFKHSYSDPEFRQKLAKRILQRNRTIQKPRKTGSKSSQRNFSNGGGTSFDTSSGFLSAITAFSYCGEIDKNSQFEILKDYLVENNGKKVFYSHLGKFRI